MSIIDGKRVTMEELFSPFMIQHIKLKNRIVMPPLASFLIGSDGCIAEAAVEHYRRRAAGGPAMVMMEACSVSPEGVVSQHQARIYEDRFVEGLAQIARAIKTEGAVPAIQIHHGGRQTSAYVEGGLTTNESIKILKILVEAGIDAVQVSAGNDLTAEWICQPMFMKKACLVDSASQVKKALPIPVMAVGRINDPHIANEIID